MVTNKTFNPVYLMKYCFNITLPNFIAEPNHYA